MKSTTDIIQNLLLMFENMDIKDSNKFIVPIYEITKDGYYFNGTGFIVDKYLISAGHVFEDGLKYSYLFENVHYDLSEKAFFREYEIDENPHKDLQIFTINDLGSPYIFFKDEYIDRQKVFLHGYSYNDEAQIMSVDEHEVAIRTFAFNYVKEIRPLKLDNCISYEEPCGKKGNSGCPLIHNNIIYGMNIGEAGQNPQSIFGRAIRSTYIIDIINKHNNR